MLMAKADLFVSFKTARELVRLGFMLNTAFSWYSWGEGMDGKHTGLQDCKAKGDDYPAPTFDELWAIIPEKIYCERFKTNMYLSIYKDSMLMIVDCLSEFGELLQKTKHEKPCEALAQTVLWLLQEGYLKGDCVG